MNLFDVCNKQSAKKTDTQKAKEGEGGRLTSDGWKSSLNLARDARAHVERK